MSVAHKNVGFLIGRYLQGLLNERHVHQSWLYFQQFFDLHYQAKENAEIINLGIGNLWRLAVDCAESDVLPCVHRAPIEKDGNVRLLLIC